jgi:Helix-turn-helix domain
MEAHIALDQPNTVSKATRKKTRTRRPLPPLEAREWMTADETALTLGCSVATLHRLRRGLILRVEPLPCSQYGRKVVFRKTSVALWQANNEQRGLAK